MWAVCQLWRSMVHDALLVLSRIAMYVAELPLLATTQK
jgi:hypothetical protein